MDTRDTDHLDEQLLPGGEDIGDNNYDGYDTNIARTKNMSPTPGEYLGIGPLEEKPEKLKQNNWLSTSSVIVANMLGAGILGLPQAVRDLDWAPAAILLVCITGFSIYGGLVLGWLRGNNHHIKTYSELAAHAAQKHGPRTANFWRVLTRTLFFSYIMGTCTIYLITMKISLMEIFEKCETTETHLSVTCGKSGCSKNGIGNLNGTVWLLITAAILYPLIHIRSIADAAWASYVGVLTIIIVNIVIIVRCCIDAVNGTAIAVHYDRSFQDRVNGLTDIAFAYGGHVLMVDFMMEMKNPFQFHKSVVTSQSFMMMNYAIIGFLGYYAYGNSVQSPVTLSLPDDALGSFTNACLFIHLMVAYCINSTVICTNFCNALWPGFMSSRRPGLGRLKTFRWAIISSSVLFAAIVLGTVIPFFSDLMAIYSSIGVFSMSFAIPAAMFLLAFYSDIGIIFRLFNFGLMAFGIVGGVVGIYAAIYNINDKWKVCDYKIDV